jgi:hypothetical protein
LHGDLLRSRRAEKERRDIDAVKFLGEPEPGKNGANFALGKPAKTR